MAVTLNASTSSGFIQTADTSGELVIQSNGTTELTVLSTGVTVADNLLFNSGYGSAAIGYGCRAWVNFDGTTNTGGFCTIRASGNVTSVADNAAGLYTINFTNAMPDANYAVACSGGLGSSSSNLVFGVNTGTSSTDPATLKTTTQVQVRNRTSNNTSADASECYFSIFR
jgi:hypothetical protein